MSDEVHLIDVDYDVSHSHAGSPWSFMESVPSTGWRFGIVYAVMKTVNGQPESIRTEWYMLRTWEELGSATLVAVYPMPEDGRLVWQAMYNAGDRNILGKP